MKFDISELKKLYTPAKNSNGEDNGQIVIIGGSSLFHGAPLLSLSVASRLVDMVFFASPDKSVGEVASKIKSKLFSFVWIPWEDLESYIKKADAILIGPGFMRYSSENITPKTKEECDESCQLTKNITQDLLQKFTDKKWVIDAGSLQTMDAKLIPKNSILTPNKKEFKLLFGKEFSQTSALEMSKKHNCILVVKGPTTFVFNGKDVISVEGGNPGLTKGGTGDVQAGLTAALLAKNNPLLAATSAAFLIKYAADELFKTKGVYYNSDDISLKIPETLKTLTSN